MNSPKPTLTIRIPAPPRKGRHYRLLCLWEAWAAQRPWVTLEWVPYRESHAASFQAAYDKPFDTDYLMLTEHDFLPDPELCPARVTRNGRNWAAPSFVRRNEGFKEYELLTGGWFIVIPKDFYAKGVKFQGGPPFYDCANQLAYDPALGDMDLVHSVCGIDDFPAVHYPGIGTHLFFSRHYDDAPAKVLAGLHESYPQTVGEMLALHDGIVGRYEIENGWA